MSPQTPIAAGPARREPLQEAQVSEDNPRIVIAEKDLSFRRMISDLLKEMGFDNVAATPSGTMAWTLLKHQPTNLLIVGWNLQEISGLSLLKIVRADSDYVTLPFLLVAEVVTQDQVVEAGEAGVSEMLCRPITLDRLQEKVNDLLYPSEDASRQEAERVYARGLRLMAEERWDEAMAIFEHILTLYESPEVYYNLGYINTVMERYEEAITFFRRATEIDQSFARAYQRIGECLLAMGKQKKAEEYLKRAAAIQLERDKHEKNRGEVLQEVMRVNPKTINIFNTLGIIYRRQGRYEEAAVQYRKALKVNPNDENIHYNLARSLFEMNNWEPALNSLRKALKLNPEFEDAKNLLEEAKKRLSRKKGFA